MAADTMRSIFDFGKKIPFFPEGRGIMLGMH